MSEIFLSTEPLDAPFNKIESRLIESVDDSFKDKVSEFIYFNKYIDINKQKKVMADFWHELGFNMPDISNDQAESISSQIEGSSRRLILTPFLKLSERKSIYKKSNTVFGGQLVSLVDSMISNDLSTVYSNLMRSSDGQVELDNQQFAIKYLTAGKLMNRSGYLDYLVNNNQAIISSEGRTWGINLIDFNEKSNHLLSPDSSENQNNPSPESLIAHQLILMATGDTNYWTSRLSNEVIYRVDNDGNSGEVVGTVVVNWLSHNKQGYLSVINEA